MVRKAVRLRRHDAGGIALLSDQGGIGPVATDLRGVIALRPDALIMADPGLIMLVLEKMEHGGWPEVPIHLSVQANTMNYAAVKFWQ